MHRACIHMDTYRYLQNAYAYSYVYTYRYINIHTQPRSFQGKDSDGGCAVIERAASRWAMTRTPHQNKALGLSCVFCF